MNAIKYRIAIFSEDPDSLANFYTQVLGFKQAVKVETKDEYGYSIEVAPGYKLWIARHSEISGISRDSHRIMLSIYVEDIDSYFTRIHTIETVRILEEPVIVCKEIKGEERLVGAFLDPDGNCVQLMQLTGR